MHEAVIRSAHTATAVRMLDGEVSDAIEAASLGLRNDYIHIYSNRSHAQKYNICLSSHSPQLGTQR